MTDINKGDIVIIYDMNDNIIEEGIFIEEINGFYNIQSLEGIVYGYPISEFFIIKRGC
jgi:hypothetical protein